MLEVNMRGYKVLFLIFVSIMVFAMNIKEVEAIESKLILIDPGHGGFDGGAEVDGIKEKDLNLQVSLLFKEELMKRGYKVILTRDKDEAIRLDDKHGKIRKGEDMAARCKMKMDSNCDMFISIHMNQFPESKYFGGQVWYSEYEKSKVLASIVQKNFKVKINEKNKRVEKSAGDHFKVLRCNDVVPALIVECGFLSNAEELRKLNSEEYQRKLAKMLTDSIDEYYKS